MPCRSLNIECSSKNTQHPLIDLCRIQEDPRSEKSGNQSKVSLPVIETNLHLELDAVATPVHGLAAMSVSGEAEAGI